MSMLWGGWLNPLGLDAHTDARKVLKKDEWNRITIQAVGDTIKTWLNHVPAAHWKTDKYTQGFFSLGAQTGRLHSSSFRRQSKSGRECSPASQLLPLRFEPLAQIAPEPDPDSDQGDVSESSCRHSNGPLESARRSRT